MRRDSNHDGREKITGEANGGKGTLGQLTNQATFVILTSKRTAQAKTGKEKLVSSRFLRLGERADV